MVDRRRLPHQALALLWNPMVIGAGVLAAAVGAVGPLVVGWLLDYAVPAQGWRMLGGVAAASILALSMADALKAVEMMAWVRLTVAQTCDLGAKAMVGLPMHGAKDLEEGDAANLAVHLNTCMEAWSATASGIAVSVTGLVSGSVGLLMTGLDLAAGMALVAAAFAGVGMSVAASRQRRQLRHLEAARAVAQAASAAEVADAAGALATLKTLPEGSHDFGYKAFARFNRLGAQSQAVVARWGLVRTVIRTAGTLGGLALLWLAGDRTPGAIGGGTAALVVILGSLDGLLNLRASLESYWPAFDRLERLAVGLVGTPRSGNDPGPLRSLEVRDLWFRYSPDGPWVLQGVNLALRAGEVLHLQWPSGSGKSTLLRLLAGVERAERGEIRVNGIPLDQVDLVAYRARLGVLTQEASILSGSVMDLLRPAISAGDLEAAAWRLLDQVEASTMVRALPLGLHTHLVQGGAGLSGGEMRRLALALALHPRAELLLLDEPLAGLGEEDGWIEKATITSSRLVLVAGHERSDGQYLGPRRIQT